MIVDVYIEPWSDSVVHSNLKMTLHLWKGKNICKGRGIEMKIEWKQVKWCSFCVILTATVSVESCGEVFIPDVINKLRIKNTYDIRTGIKDSPTDGN